jgi:hypothetical protein
MTIRFVKNLCAVGVLAVAAAVSAVAQSSSLQVTVPFAFLVNGVKLSAGDYSIQKVDETGTLLIHGQQSAMVQSNSTGDYTVTSEVPGLSFERNADGVPVLTKVQITGEPTRAIMVHAPAAASVKALVAVK